VIGIGLGDYELRSGDNGRRRPKVIINEEGNRLTPSVVAFTKDGEVLVGQAAKSRRLRIPRTTIFSIKRFVGRRYTRGPGKRSRLSPTGVERSGRKCQG